MAEEKFNYKKFIKEIKDGQYGWSDSFTDVLNEEGVELRDFDLYPEERQKKIAKKLKDALEKESN